ncbi:rod shape-determining protein MreC [Streptococcus caballi]|uniref:rod shape-determining protein MreC n=1 Tax=Streptococcus caballi TaxID=439220 RepID=UPI00047692D7|nr:rod shape-determining protein MreC [Streptococcus caballi]
MKRFRISRFIFFIMLSLLVVIVFLFIFFKGSAKASNLTSPISLAVSKVDYVISAPFRFVSGVQDNVTDLLNTYSENKRLKAEISKSNSESNLLVILKEENEALKNEIGVGDSDKKKVVGKVIVRSSASWYDSLRVEVSKSDSLGKNMLVSSNGGLIGSVKSVDGNSINVDLLTKGSNLSIPVKLLVSSGEIYGVLKSYRSSDNLFVVSELNSSDAVDVGNLVVTSGLDGSSVSDVPVGKVVKVTDSKDSLARKVYIKPIANFAKISYVTIIGD